MTPSASTVRTALLFFLLSVFARADFSWDAFPQSVDILSRLVSATEHSKADYLTPHIDPNDGPRDTTLSGLDRFATIPRVARSSQPWAGRFNAFGVGRTITSIKAHDIPPLNGVEVLSWLEDSKHAITHHE